MKIAVDLECIPLLPEPDFSDPLSWAPFAVGIACQTSSEGITTKTVLRDDWSFEAESRLYHDTIGWINARIQTRDTTGDATEPTLLTYNGVRYDLPVLETRAHRVDFVTPPHHPAVTPKLDELQNRVEHVDLIEWMRDLQGYFVPLIDALAMCNSLSPDYYPCYNGEKISGEDMPWIGDAVLQGEASNELLDALETYVLSDVTSLFKLHRRLRKRRE